MHERKRGTLRSGRSGKRVTSRKQAIAIGLSEARRAGGKVPPERRLPPLEQAELGGTAGNGRRPLALVLLKGWARALRKLKPVPPVTSRQRGPVLLNKGGRSSLPGEG
jgi:hypothetical protein